MRGALAISLAQRVGQVLTLCDAREIVREVLNSDDRSISPAVVPAETWGAYRVQCEAIDQVLPELARHHAAYHREVSAGGPPLDYDYPRLLDLWRAGRAFLVTARGEGVMVASLLVFIGQRIDTRTDFTQDDRFWVDPEHRGGMLAVRIWRFTERVVLALGIREGWIESRAETGADRMAKFLGYRLVAHKYVKTAAQDACGPERSRP